MNLNFVLSFLQSHAAPFVLGVVVSHPGLCADLVFQGCMKVPFLKKLLMTQLPLLNKWVDSFQDELNKDAVEQAVKEAPKP